MAEGAYDVIVLTETNLTTDIDSSELGLPDYMVYRKDRSLTTSSKESGGGVMIAVSGSLGSGLIAVSVDSVEHLFVYIHLGNLKVIIGGVYIPPSSPLIAYENHCAAVDSVMSRYTDHILYLAGDYNLPHAPWYNDDLGVACLEDGRATVQTVCSSFSYHNLYQINEVVNVNRVRLDLVFSHDKTAFTVIADDPLLPCDHHHPAIVVHIPRVRDPKELTYDTYYYNFKMADFNGLNDYLCNVDWDQCFNNVCDINVAVDIFYDYLYEAINMFVPIARLKTPKFPKWFSSELKNTIFEKKAAHKLYKTNNDWNYYSQFSDLRNKCKQLKKTCYNDYIKNIENSLNGNIKIFWEHVNTKRNCNIIPNSMFLNGNNAHDGESIVNLFREYFQGTYSYDDSDEADVDLTNNGQQGSLDLESVNISLAAVFEGMLSLDPKKGPGPDGVPPSLLIGCAYSLSKPLWFLFSLSLKSGSFPDLWKNAFITPIFKSGNRANISDYRPISVLNSIPKLFEKIVCDCLSTFMNSVIVPEQHGFFQGRSAATNMLLYTQYVLDALESRRQVDVIYTDFSKAFDTVNHKMLISKLEVLGVRGTLLSWLGSYLIGRKQYVKLKGYVSKDICVASGVPQGSHLGPRLFNLFINDLPSVVFESRCLLYADDLKIFKIIDMPADTRLLQDDLNRVELWCQKNKLLLNPTKCKQISFFRTASALNEDYNIGGKTLEKVKSISDLGLVLDIKMDFHLHYDTIVNRAYKLLGFIRRTTKDINNIDCLNFLYKSLVVSRLEYLSCVWSPTYLSHIALLEKVQNKYIQFASFKIRFPLTYDNYDAARRILNLERLQHRRIKADINLLFKVMNGIIDCPELLSRFGLRAPLRWTRQTELFAYKFHRCNYGIHSPISRIAANGNRCEIDFFNSSLNSFKNKIRKLQL